MINSKKTKKSKKLVKSELKELILLSVVEYIINRGAFSYI